MQRIQFLRVREQFIIEGLFGMLSTIGAEIQHSIFHISIARDLELMLPLKKSIAIQVIRWIQSLLNVNKI